METALEVCWPGLDPIAEGGLLRVFCVFCVFCEFCEFEGVGFPEPFVTVVMPGFAGFAGFEGFAGFAGFAGGFPVFPPPVVGAPGVTVTVAVAVGAGFAGGFGVVVVEAPPRTFPTTEVTPFTVLSRSETPPPKVSPRSARSLSCRSSRGTFSLGTKSTFKALKERSWIAAACARGRKGVFR